jgi:hypothetical protein
MKAIILQIILDMPVHDFSSLLCVRIEFFSIVFCRSSPPPPLSSNSDSGFPHPLSLCRSFPPTQLKQRQWLSPTPYHSLSPPTLCTADALSPLR